MNIEHRVMLYALGAVVTHASGRAALDARCAAQISQVSEALEIGSALVATQKARGHTMSPTFVPRLPNVT